MRVFNFSAGPAVMPEEVLQQARDEMMDWRGSGMSVMEMSHRGKEFIGIADQAEADLRELLAIPDDYTVLFLQGGAIAENAIVPMNLLRGKTKADYVNTGEWSKKSLKEAKKYCTVNVAASAEDEGFTYVPKQETWKFVCPIRRTSTCAPNETIAASNTSGTPDTGGRAAGRRHVFPYPLAAGRRCALWGHLRRGRRKNVGPAGLTLVIVRGDLLGQGAAVHPFCVRLQAAVRCGLDVTTRRRPTRSTSPAWCFEWLQRQGGVAAIERRNIAKAKLLYDYLDGSSFFRSPVRRRPLADERAVQARATRRSTSVPEGDRRKPAWCS
jgi:phosphoserine aminotransferase